MNYFTPSIVHFRVGHELSYIYLQLHHCSDFQAQETFQLQYSIHFSWVLTTEYVNNANGVMYAEDMLSAIRLVVLTGVNSTSYSNITLLNTTQVSLIYNSSKTVGNSSNNSLHRTSPSDEFFR